MDKERAYLEAASQAVERQMQENPGVPIPVDPDVAEYMAAMPDDALSFSDALEGAQPIQEED
jgi:hypothetical protein